MLKQAGATNIVNDVEELTDFINAFEDGLNETKSFKYPVSLEIIYKIFIFIFFLNQLFITNIQTSQNKRNQKKYLFQ